MTACVRRDGVERDGRWHGVDDELADADVTTTCLAAASGDTDADVVGAVSECDADNLIIAGINTDNGGGVKAPGACGGVVADAGVAGSVNGAIDGGGDGDAVEREGEDVTIG